MWLYKIREMSFAAQWRVLHWISGHSKRGTYIIADMLSTDRKEYFEMLISCADKGIKAEGDRFQQDKPV